MITCVPVAGNIWMWQIGIGTGNPGVFLGYPYPNPSLRVPAQKRCLDWTQKPTKINQGFYNKTPTKYMLLGLINLLQYSHVFLFAR